MIAMNVMITLLEKKYDDSAGILTRITMVIMTTMTNNNGNATKPTNRKQKKNQTANMNQIIITKSNQNFSYVNKKYI